MSRDDRHDGCSGDRTVRRQPAREDLIVSITLRAPLARPNRARLDPELVTACARACLSAQRAAHACANDALTRGRSELKSLIRVALDVEDIARATGRVLSRTGDLEVALVQAQLLACLCAAAALEAECDRHATENAFALCANACDEVQDVCRELLVALPP